MGVGKIKIRVDGGMLGAKELSRLNQDITIFSNGFCYGVFELLEDVIIMLYQKCLTNENWLLTYLLTSFYKAPMISTTLSLNSLFPHLKTAQR